MLDGLQRTANSDSAIIVLHEVYGINPYMNLVCQNFHSKGYDVYCPNLLGMQKYFTYALQEEAYTHFIENVGFSANRHINDLGKNIREQYKYVFLVGFSVGATLAWLCSTHKLFDGAVCCYGSRIRDYCQISPCFPVLLIFASNEASFSPNILLPRLITIPNVSGEVIKGDHGFCDPFSPNYNAQAAMRAKKMTQEFLLGIQAK